MFFLPTSTNRSSGPVFWCCNSAHFLEVYLCGCTVHIGCRSVSSATPTGARESATGSKLFVPFICCKMNWNSCKGGSQRALTVNWRPYIWWRRFLTAQTIAKVSNSLIWSFCVFEKPRLMFVTGRSLSFNIRRIAPKPWPEAPTCSLVRKCRRRGQARVLQRVTSWYWKMHYLTQGPSRGQLS